jgi:CheY-like chemotaxis protein
VKRLVARELTLSFVPNAEQRLWRTVTRRKYQLTRDHVRLQNQLESLLEEAHIKLSSVVSNLLGASARRMLKAPIDVLVTDVVMPRMRGTELAMRLRRAHPDISVVYMSGYLEHDSDDSFLADAELLQKPFSRDSLLQKLYAMRARDAAQSVYLS